VKIRVKKGRKLQNLSPGKKPEPNIEAASFTVICLIVK
jgi:hypothetical protein